MILTRNTFKKLTLTAFAAFFTLTFSALAFGQTTLTQNTGTLGCCSYTEVGISQQGGTAAYLGLLQSTSTLTSPSFTLDGTTGEQLNFNARTFGGVTPARNIITVSISTDDGASYTVLGTRTPTNTTLNAQAAFDLSGFSGTQVRIRFQTLGANGTVGAGIDDILVTGFSPTASAAEISGRVIDNENRGLARVSVTLSGGSMRSTTVLTNAFGYYTFPEVAVGQTYVVSVASKIYTFNQPTLVFTVNENLTDINFIGYR